MRALVSVSSNGNVGGGCTIQFVRRRGQVGGFEATDRTVRRVAFEKVDGKK